MATIGLFFGTQTGIIEDLADQIQVALGGSSVVEVNNIAEVSPDDFANYEHFIIGCPTWNMGELQSDWENFFEELDDVDFSNKKVAYFGAGDQVGYADNFQDALGILEEKISGLGGVTVGFWPIEGYAYNASKAVKDGQFVGLAIDEINQPELTAPRIANWTTQIKREFGL